MIKRLTQALSPPSDPYLMAKWVRNLVVCLMLLHVGIMGWTVTADLIDGEVQIETGRRLPPIYRDREGYPDTYWADIRKRLYIAAFVDGGVIAFACLLPWLNRPRPTRPRKTK